MRHALRTMKTCVLSLGLVSANIAHADEAPTIDVMFYNVLNLFDTKHDEGKDDWTFLPKDFPGKKAECEKISVAYYRQECLESDWTEKSLKIKLNQMSKAVKAATKNKLPDLLGLCEVENDQVVGQLAKKLGYSSFTMTDSPDERGIDVALIYKESTNLKFVGKREYVLGDKAIGRPTRNILEAEFNVNGETLYVYVNHWPSQTAQATVRVAAAKALQEAIAQRQAEKPAAYVLAMGDYNTVEGDFPHPFKSVILDRQTTTKMYDVHDLFFQSKAPKDVKNMTPNGTYFYGPRMSWDRLDRFFVNPRLHAQNRLRVDATSYRILAAEEIRTTYTFDRPEYFSYGTTVANTPWRGNPAATSEDDAGFSDHFPIFVKLAVGR